MMKRKTLAAMIAGLSLGVVGQAQAGALATSVVEFTNFEIFRISSTDNSNLGQLDASNLTNLTYTNSADVLASFIGGGTDTDGGSGTPLDLYASVGVDTSTATGNGIYDDNDFAQLSSSSGLPNSSGNFAISDTNEQGFPITGLGNPTNADVQTASYVSLSGSAEGTSQSNNELTASFSFTAQTSDFLLFEFDVATFVEAYLDLGEIADSKASASWAITLQLENLTNPSFILDVDLGCSASRTAPGGSTGTPTHGLGSGDCGLAASDIQALTTSALTVGDTYEFNASVVTRADAKVVPAPGVMALMGLGLLGMSGVRRAQKRLAG